MNKHNLLVDLETLALSTDSFELTVDEWQVAPGECVALIGKNGSGKSTVIEAILGLRKVGAMKGRLLGVDFSEWAGRTDLRFEVGALLQRCSPPAGVYVSDLVALHRNLYRRSSSQVLEALGIDRLKHKKYDRLSRGEIQRVDLFMALAHEPALLFLDEPFTGLDAEYAAATSQLIASRNDKRAVVMSCHGPAELALASRVTWIAAGKVKADASPDALRKELLCDYHMKVTFCDEIAAYQFFDQCADVGERRKSVRGNIVNLAGDELTLNKARSDLSDRDIMALEFSPTGLGELLKHCAQLELQA